MQFSFFQTFNFAATIVGKLFFFTFQLKIFTRYKYLLLLLALKTLCVICAACPLFPFKPSYLQRSQALIANIHEWRTPLTIRGIVNFITLKAIKKRTYEWLVVFMFFRRGALKWDLAVSAFGCNVDRNYPLTPPGFWLWRELDAWERDV